MRETVIYSENQYHDGQLVLLGQCSYELKFDTLKRCYFVMNQNNEIIYLDKIRSVSVVRISPNQMIVTSFFHTETTPEFLLDVKKSHQHILFDILYIIIVVSVIVFLSLLFHFFQESRSM